VAKIKGWTKDINHQYLLQYTTIKRYNTKIFGGRVFSILEIIPKNDNSTYYQLEIKRATTNNNYKIFFHKKFKTKIEALNYARNYMRSHPNG